MERFKVTKHFNVYGDKSGKAATRYSCKHCHRWVGFSFEDAKAHYLSNHLGQAHIDPIEARIKQLETENRQYRLILTALGIEPESFEVPLCANVQSVSLV
jgi:hypothetical protein